MKVLNVWEVERKPRENRDGRDSLRTTVKVETDVAVSWTWLRKQQRIPKTNDEHHAEKGLYLVSIEPTQTAPRIWELQLQWEVFEAKAIDPSPTSRPAIVTIDSQLIDQPTLFDADGRPIVTTAGEFIPGLSIKVPVLEYRIRKNLGSDPDWIDTHLGATNKEPVTLRGKTRKAGTLFLTSFSAGEVERENRVDFSEYSLSILYDPRGWKEEIWNLGTVELARRLVRRYTTDKAGNKKLTAKLVWTQQPITRNGEKVSEPVPIDANGYAIPEFIEPAVKPDPGKLHKLEFNLLKKQPFSVLPLK